MGRDVLLERTQVLPRSPEDVFGFFGDARNLEAITPAWLRFRIVEAPEQLERGSFIRYRLRLFGVPIRWRRRSSTGASRAPSPTSRSAGPYPLWIHTHRFTPVAGGTEVYDVVRYRVPGGILAAAVERLVARWLDDIFDYRRERLAELLGHA